MDELARSLAAAFSGEDDARAVHDAAERELAAARDEVAGLEAWIASNAAAVALGRRVEAEDVEVAALLEIDAAIRESELREAESRREEGEAAARAARAEREASTAATGLKAMRVNAERLGKTVAAANGPAMRVALAAVIAMRNAVGQAVRASREAGDTAAAAVRERRDRDEAQARLAFAREAGAEVDRELPLARARLDEVRRSFDLSKAAAGEVAEALRALLQDDQPCPVCGSTEHPLYGADGPWAARLADDRRRLEERDQDVARLAERGTWAAQEAESARRDLERLDVEAAALVPRGERFAREWREARADLVANAAAAGVTLNALPEDPLDIVAPTSAEALVPPLDARLQELEESLDAHDRESARLRDLELEIRAAQDSVTKLRDEAAAGRETVLRARASADKAAATRDEKSSTRDAMAARIDRLLAPLFPDWSERVLAEPDAVLDFIRETAEQATARRARLEEARGRAERCSDECTAARERLDAKRSAAEERRAEHELRSGELDSWQRQRAALFEGRSADEVRADFQSRVTAADAARDAAQLHLLTVANRFSECATRVEEATVEGRAADEEGAKTEAALAAALARHGLDEAGVWGALEAGEERLEQEQQRLCALRDTVLRAQTTLEERRGARERHVEAGAPTETRDTLDLALPLLRTQLEDTQGAEREAGAKLQVDDEARRAAEGIRAELDERRAEARLWAQLNELIGSADGARFRRFAQCLTLTQLLQLSNDHLARLAPRYELQRAPGDEMSLSLQVVDHDMGDDVRGVHNLSGGERFLVSLALALGLAGMSGAQGTRVDSLFIDEGFGALDEASLGVAVAALESLQSTGRKVGVISHVAELKERIPVQVRVVPCGGGRSELEIVQT